MQRAVGSTSVVAPDLNPGTDDKKSIQSRRLGSYRVWAEPTALYPELFPNPGFKSGATVFVEPNGSLLNTNHVVLLIVSFEAPKPACGGAQAKACATVSRPKEISVTA